MRRSSLIGNGRKEKYSPIPGEGKKGPSQKAVSLAINRPNGPLTLVKQVVHRLPNGCSKAFGYSIPFSLVAFKCQKQGLWSIVFKEGHRVLLRLLQIAEQLFMKARVNLLVGIRNIQDEVWTLTPTLQPSSSNRPLARARRPI